MSAEVKIVAAEELPEPKKQPSFTDVPIEDKERKPLQFTKSFVFDYHSEEDEKHYLGTFTCRRLSLGLIGQVGVQKSRLNSGELVDRYTDQLHEMLAYLSVALTDMPEWWSPHETYDPMLLRSVYEHVRLWEDSFRKRGNR